MVAKINFWTKWRIGQASQNQDILMFNLILQALKPTLNSRGSTVPDDRYCKSYDDSLILCLTGGNSFRDESY